MASKCLDSITYRNIYLSLSQKIPNLTGARFSNSLTVSGVLYRGRIEPNFRCQFPNGEITIADFVLELGI